MNEPTVLDYLKSIFNKEKRIKLDTQFYSEYPEKKKKNSDNFAETKNSRTGKKFLFWGIAFALTGQLLLELPKESIILPIILYLAAIAFFWISLNAEQFLLNDVESSITETNSTPKLKFWPFITSLVFLILAFYFFSNNSFTYKNLFFWISGIVFFIYSIWQKNVRSSENYKVPSSFYVACGIVLLLTTFFRFYLLNKVPGEMFSDHAEKLLDVMDILEGKAPIFFVRNTGREALQFYLTAGLIKIFKTGISFISLKLGTSLLGFLTLPFIYLLGKQLFNTWVGVLGSLFAGIAYWPNVISRVGLRFPLYPLFSAITLYFLIKGLHEKKYNMLLIAGLFLGLGLHGYSPIRIVPILVAIIVLIFIFHERSQSKRLFAINGFLILAFSALIVFLPLFRYLLENPSTFNYRALSRLTPMENPINGPVLLIFLTNLWISLIMVFYKNGVVWVNSIPGRPALDVVSAVFFLYGVIILVKRYGKTKNWQDLSLLISIPILMLPSIMSLAFPNENPALNRSGGAIVPIFIIIGVGFTHFIKVIIENNEKMISKLVGSFVALALILISIFQNYDLVFNEYSNQFLANAWNTSEIGRVITQFVEKGNSPDNAFVIPFPHWVDTRLVGINAGFPRKDYALWSEDINSTFDIAGEKLFILMPQDRNSLGTLKLLYPQAEEEFYYSKISGKNFIIVLVKT